MSRQRAAVSRLESESGSQRKKANPHSTFRCAFTRSLARSLMEVDVVVIGAGVVGSAVARALAKWSAHRLSIVVLERHSSAVAAASAGNSGIFHTGFDAPYGRYALRLGPATKLATPHAAECVSGCVVASSTSAWSMAAAKRGA